MISVVFERCSLTLFLLGFFENGTTGGPNDPILSKSSIKKLTLFWLGFFMYVKWLGGGKFTPPV